MKKSLILLGISLRKAEKEIKKQYETNALDEPLKYLDKIVSDYKDLKYEGNKKKTKYETCGDKIDKIEGELKDMNNILSDLCSKMNYLYINEQSKAFEDLEKQEIVFNPYDVDNITI